MHYRAVVDQFGQPPVLDPLASACFVAAFVASVLLASRRPAYALCALWISAPLAFEHVVGPTTVTLEKVVLLGTIAGLTAYPGCLARLRERPIAPLLIALACYAAAMAVSIGAAAYAAPAVRETMKAIEYLALCATACLCYRLDPDDGPIVVTVAVTAGIVCASALVQEIAGAPSGLCVGDVVTPRIAGLLEGPNQLAGFLESSVAVLAAWNVVRPSRWGVAMLAIAALTDVLTFSRAGLVALAIVAATVALVHRARAVDSLKWIGGGALAGAAVAAGWAASLHEAGIFRLTMLQSECAGGVGSRTQLYGAAVRLWLQHPWFGVGAGNFELELPEAGVAGVRTHANSWYLQSLVEGGIPLAAATLAVAGVSLASFARRLRAGSPWVLAAFAATLALALHQVVDYLFFYPKVAEPWLLSLGIGAAAAAARRTD
ncbi:MAG TPA: O-antigen ligase family protein [Candidatus Acidoferrales bacterium]|nr:O-antigen ligase family protein [Candidatus Acidoferrales bacterium]